jgi:hypothetical protein
MRDTVKQFFSTSAPISIGVIPASPAFPDFLYFLPQRPRKCSK